MKVLQVIDTLAVGGAERVMVDLCNLLQDNGLQVEVLTLLDPGQLSAQLNSPIKTSSLRRRHRFDLKAGLAFIRMARKSDLVHVHMRHNFRYCRFWALLSGLKTPIILHDHFGQFQEGITKTGAIDHLLKPDWYIGVSKPLTRWARNQLGLKNDQTMFLSNIIVRERIQVASKKTGLVLVSNIKPVKNQLFILDVLAKTRHSLTLIGAVQSADYFNEIQSRITELGLNERVQFVQDCNSTQQELPRFKLGLHVSTLESGPLVLIEYLAQGLPFLAYAKGEIAELIRPEFPEFFLDTLDQDQWVQRIEYLMNTPPDTAKMQRYFDALFSSQAYTEKCLNFYQRVIGC